ncbi:MAG: hypothetical protein ACREJC_05710, partial [Tepidisphaeraceae bacterium]
MRRGRLLTILTFVFVLAGLVLLGWDARRLSALAQSDCAFAGLSLLLTGAISGCMSIVLIRSDGRRIAATLAGQVRSGRLGYLDAPSGELLPVVRSVNDVLTFAERSVTDAAVSLKELEVQLKVATAQRQHAQAILY